jgi:hypothetical protein
MQEAQHYIRILESVLYYPDADFYLLLLADYAEFLALFDVILAKVSCIDPDTTDIDEYALTEALYHLSIRILSLPEEYMTQDFLPTIRSQILTTDVHTPKLSGLFIYSRHFMKLIRTSSTMLPL